MDVLPRIIRQLSALFREMSPAQRMMTLVVASCTLVGFGWLIASRNDSDFRPISFGKTLSAEELTSAERALARAGLNTYRRQGQQLLVPSKDLDRYNAALLESDALPSDLGTQMLKQFETLGPFSTDRQRQQMKEALLLRELQQMIKAVPDVEDARVVIAAADRRTSWNQKSRTTANVSVKPKSGRELSPNLINSLRHVVANMVSDLKPADVTVFDVSRGQAHTGEASVETSDSAYLQRAREFTRQYEHQIQKALSYIPSANVTVHVDLDTLKSSMFRSETVRSRGDIAQTANRPGTIEETESHEAGFRGSSDAPMETVREISEKQIATAIPKSVQVSVSVPRDFIRDVVANRISKGERSANRLDAEMVEDEVLAKIERIVRRLIPSDSPNGAISVTVVEGAGQDLIDADATTINPAILSHPWVGPAAVALVVLFVFALLLRAVSGGQPESPQVTTASVSSESNDVAATPIAASVQPVVLDRTAELRQEVRTRVESDPAGTASILMKWLVEA